MRKKWYIIGTAFVALNMVTTSFATDFTYLTQAEYNDVMYNNYTEDRGIVVENSPQLGYLIYKNSRGQEVTCNYYSGEVVVEKQPYYETEDKIGYLDELFPNFEFDPRDTQIENIKAGDCVYIRKNAEGAIIYISAYNDYFMRYGKVVSFQYSQQDQASLQLQDEKGNIYVYELALNTPVSKGKKSVSLNTIKTGDWVKVLVSQKILGEGIIDEEALEIVVDNDNRTISNVYCGQVTSLDTYKKLINIKNAQALEKKSWSQYNPLLRLSIEPKSAAIYQNGNRVSADYLKRYLTNTDGYVYIAAEDYKGKENAVKLNFQSNYQKTLPASTVIASDLNSVKLLSGETLSINEESIVVRDNRLVDGGSIVVGDTIQAVVSGDNKLAVGKVSQMQTTGSLSVFRGRIKKVEDRESFQVETFSTLDNSLWYYHPTPQTFTIDHETKFYNDSGLVEDGIEQFLSYGENTNVGQVYTIVANGAHAEAVVDMPYARQAVKGEIYNIEDKKISVKDAYYYDTANKKWIQYSRKNIGGVITMTDNSVIIKNGKLVSASKLEAGDTISVMVNENLKTANGAVSGYILVVEN